MANSSQSNAALDNKIMNRVAMGQAAISLWEQQQGARREGQEQTEQNEYEYASDEALEEELGEAVEDIAKKKSKLIIIKHAIKLGFILRKQASDLRFDGLGFWVVLIFSGIKDISDGVTGGFGGMFTTWLIVPTLAIFFFMQSSMFKRFFIKRFFGKYITAVILGFFPGTSIFPTYVIATLFLKRKIDKEVKRLKEEARQMDKEAVKLKSVRV